MEREVNGIHEWTGDLPGSLSSQDLAPVGAAGRLVEQAVNGQTRVYGYDFMSRMTSLTDTNGSVFSYAFDGEGNRTLQSLNDCLVTRFVYDGPNVVLELNASNQVVRAYVNGPGLDQPIECMDFINGTPRNRQVFHTDGLGSVSVLTDENGATIQAYAYEAFGKIRTRTGADLNRITYTAREAIGDSLGFYYYRNRDFDPSTGRFTSEDPLGFVDGENRYGYVVNNPLIDPYGLCTGAGQYYPGYWTRYFQHLNAYSVNVGPAAWALFGGLWPKSWSISTGGRPPSLGSRNPLTSLPRSLGIPCAGAQIVRGVAMGIGALTAGVGMYNVGVFISGFGYAAFPGSNGISPSGAGGLFGPGGTWPGGPWGLNSSSASGSWP